MAVGDAHVFPGFLTPVLTQRFFPKPPTAFLICFCRGERRKYAGKKSSLNRGSNSQPPGHESDTLTTEPPGRGELIYKNFMYVSVCELPLDTDDPHSVFRNFQNTFIFTCSDVDSFLILTHTIIDIPIYKFDCS